MRLPFRSIAFFIQFQWNWNFKPTTHVCMSCLKNSREKNYVKPNFGNANGKKIERKLHIRMRHSAHQTLKCHLSIGKHNGQMTMVIISIESSYLCWIFYIYWLTWLKYIALLLVMHRTGLGGVRETFVVHHGFLYLNFLMEINWKGKTHFKGKWARKYCTSR